VLPPGAQVKLSVLTQGKPHTVDVQLGVLPKNTPSQIQPMKSHDLIVDNYGLLLTDEAGQIRIKAVEPQGPADAAGLKAQDIVLSLNRQPLNSLAAAETAFKNAEKDKPNAVLIRRGNTQHFLALSLQPD
ncbi:MAG: PDZ domain-containing protein, partial [Halothiobacillus sp.]